MKTNTKRFINLNPHHNGGFTLVELIVVIAILAILAAVAVPAYSGYIEKANKAGDETLLAAVNRAFSSACLENGINQYTDFASDCKAKIPLVDGKIGQSSSATLSETAVAEIVYISGLKFADGVTSDREALARAINNSFKLFYSDNENAAFKTVENYLLFNPATGTFGFYDEAAAIEALKTVIAASNFNGKLDEMTAEVGSMIDVLASYLEEEGENALVGTGFDTYLTDVLGPADEDKTDYNKMANAAVLYLAHSAANMSDTNISSAKTTMSWALADYANDPNSVDFQDVVNNLAVDTDSGLASYAMLYATAEGLALQQKANGDSSAYDKLASATMTDPQSVLSAVGDVFAEIDSATMGAYLESNFNNDMDAYFQTLQTVNTKESELKNELDGGGLLTENETVQDLISKLQ